MPIKTVETDKAPKAIGPYNQAIDLGKTIYTSGTLPLDAVTGQISGGDIKTQTIKVFENLSAVLSKAGYKLSDVVKTTVFLKNMSDFAGMNEIYASFLKERFPARTTVEVAALPKNVLVEIEAVAVKTPKK